MNDRWINHLREPLLSMKWRDLTNKHHGRLNGFRRFVRNGHTYYPGSGLFMGVPHVAVMVVGSFVVLRKLVNPITGLTYRPLSLDYPYKRILSWQPEIDLDEWIIQNEETEEYSRVFRVV